MILYKNWKDAPEPVQAIFKDDLREAHCAVDRVFAYLLIAQWIFGILCAAIVSPLSWQGTSSEVHIHVWAAVLLGGLIVFLPVSLARTMPGRMVTRLAISAGQLSFSALLIHLLAGRIEAHFHVFISLALLSVYRDRTVFIPAVAITVVDHLVRGFLWPQSVFGSMAVLPWRPLEHAAWVIFEAGSLCFLINQSLNQCLTMASLRWTLKTERDLLESRVIDRTLDLQESRDFQGSILNSIDAEICLLRQDGEVFFANDRWKNFGDQHGGLSHGTMAGSNYFDSATADGGPLVRESAELIDAIHRIRSGELETYSVDYPCEIDQQERWFHVGVNQILLENRHAISLVQVEVTEAKVAQARAESFAKLILNSPNEVYIMAVDNFEFVEVNQGACTNLGYDRETLLTMSPADIKPEFDRDDLRNLLSDLIAGKESTIHFETLHRRQDGTEYRGDICCHMSVLEGREVIVAFVTDVTESKKMESQLLEARKLESVGQLAAGVAHEINTPMQCVFGNVEFLQSSFDRLLVLSDRVVELLDQSEVDWSEERQALEELREKYKYDYLRTQTPAAIAEATDASNQVISIIRAMKIMSHPGSKEKKATDLHDMIENAAVITRGRWKQVAELETEFDPDMIPVEVLPAEISQVFINLIVNAADAISERVETEPHPFGEIRISTRIIDDWVELQFSDNGTGISEKLKNRVFDPFFTTKEVGKGTGQGLSISRDVIVNRHSGTLDIKNTPGGGASFSIRLPRFPAPENDSPAGESQTTKPAPIAATVNNGSKSVLIEPV